MSEKHNLTTIEVTYKFDGEPKLDNVKKFALTNYAVEYLKYYGEIKPSKCYYINSYFWVNDETIRVDVTRKVLGIKHTKYYVFNLLDNKVKQIIPDKYPNIYAYSEKIELRYHNTFLGFLYNEVLKDQAKDFNIQQEVKEYKVIPFQV